MLSTEGPHLAEDSARQAELRTTPNNMTLLLDSNDASDKLSLPFDTVGSRDVSETVHKDYVTDGNILCPPRLHLHTYHPLLSRFLTCKTHTLTHSQ